MELRKSVSAGASNVKRDLAFLTTLSLSTGTRYYRQYFHAQEQHHGRYSRLELRRLAKCGVPPDRRCGEAACHVRIHGLRGGRQFILSATFGADDFKLAAEGLGANQFPILGKSLAAVHTPTRKFLVANGSRPLHERLGTVA